MIIKIIMILLLLNSGGQTNMEQDNDFSEGNLKINGEGKSITFSNQEEYEDWMNRTTILWDYDSDGMVEIKPSIEQWNKILKECVESIK